MPLSANFVQVGKQARDDGAAPPPPVADEHGRGPRAKILEAIDEHSAGCTSFCTDHTFYLVRLRKGKSESTIDIKSPEYSVHFDRTCGSRLGLKIEIQQSNECLFIKEVAGGLASSWNESAPKDKIRPGDKIVKVNDVVGHAHALNDECKQRKSLVLTLRRGAAKKVKAGLFVTVKRPFCKLQVCQQGFVESVDEDGDALIQFRGHGRQWVTKENYELLQFTDSECYYLKRYEDFRDLYEWLRKKQECGLTGEKFNGKWPELPRVATFGFRRTMSTLGVSNWTRRRFEGLQVFLDWVCSQVDSLDVEPLVAEFFGNDTVPACGGVDFRESLKQKLEHLVQKNRQSTIPEDDVVG